ncbi:MAG: hypothetical protein RL094_132 [Candidatus Parcubacteria bacterium]|jgi:hypothetical protein
MKYQVPQFIEVEDKIFGPLTFRQFVYLAGGAAICFMAYKLLPLIVSVFIIVPMGGLSIALAFYKVNNRPFIDVIEAGFKFFLTSKLYVWRKIDKKPEEKSVEDIKKELNPLVGVPRLSNSKLKDLAWSLDINETIYSREKGKLQKGAGMLDKQPPF